MLEPNRPLSDYLDDFLHGVLSEEDAARVQTWLDTAPDAKAAFAAAQRRRAALEELPPVEANERLIRRTLEGIEMKATKRHTLGRTLFRAGLAIAAVALLMLAGTNWYFYNLQPSPYGLRLIGQSRLLAGAPAALRVELRNERTGEAVPDVPLELSLVNFHTQEVVTLASFRSGDGITQSPRFTMPDWSPDNYLLRLSASTSGATEVLEEQIALRRSSKLFLSTDKPIYQPGHLIHVRALSLRRPDLKPIAGEDVEFKIFDGKDNLVFKERKQTSKFGLCAMDYQLASEVNEGSYRIECVVNDTTSTRNVKVEKYVLPKFKVEIALDKPYYAPEENVSGSIAANYFFGQPVQGGEVGIDVRSTDVASNIIHQATLKTDDQGVAKFAFALPKTLIGTPQDGGAAKFQIFATVTDAAGQGYTRMLSRLVTNEPLLLDIFFEGGTPVRDLPNVVYVHASYADGRPAQVDLTINGEATKVPTNEFGIGKFEITPRDPVVSFTIVAEDKEQHTARLARSYTCGAITNDFIVRTDKATYAGGDTMTLTALASGVQPVFVDLLKDDQTMLSATIDPTQGQGRLDVDLPPELFGSIQLVAYRFDPSGLAVRKSRLIFIQQAKQLNLTTTLNQPEYRPGEKAQLKLQLTDADGNATPGAISLSAVDEAVFSVLSQRPGLEQAFFLAEQDMLRPIYTIYPDWSPSSLNEDREPSRQLLEQAVFALTAHSASGEINLLKGFRDERQGPPPIMDAEPMFDDAAVASPESVADAAPFVAAPYTLVANTYPAKVNSFNDMRHSRLDAMVIAWFTFFGLAFVFGVVSFAIWQPKIFLIGAGAMAVLMMCGVPAVILTSFLLLGGRSPQMAFDMMEGRVAAKAEAMMAPDAMVMEGAEWDDEALPGGLGGGAPPAPPRVRQDFPETLLWRPELVTDEQGVATLDINLADSITTWRINASAVSAAGQLGETQLPLKVFQPFFVDLKLPVALTRGDEISLPVTVYSYLDKPQQVELKLEQRDWFELLVAADQDPMAQLTQTIELKPRELRAVHFRVKVKDVGQQQIKVTATAETVADAIERMIEVVPNGQLVETYRNDTLSTPGTPVVMNALIPEDAVPGSVKAFVKFHPSGFSQLVEGLDAIFRMPNGCFEQTSSTTYPNVLALDYLRTTKRSAPQVEVKARQYISAGYQRLVSFEVAGGGFDWFGRPPSNRTLTAYGLLEFTDMARVHDVDPQLIERTREWLLNQRLADGAWEPEPHMLNDGLAGSVNRGEDPKLAATAYIAWAVFHSAPQESRMPRHQQAFQLTANYLLAHRPDKLEDPYVLASVALALSAFDAQHPELPAYLARLDALKKVIDKTVYWEQPAGAARPFHGAGQSGDIETTAMATLAMLKAKAFTGTTRGSLTWLVANKDPQGTWFNTQATVLALKALLAGTNLGDDTKDRKFTIKVNDQLVQEVTITADQFDVVRQIDLSPWLTRVGDPNSVAVTELTDSATSFQAVFRHHRDVPIDDTAPPEPLAISIAYDRERLPVDEMVTATATVINQMQETAPMVILDLPIPGGFQLEPGELDELIGSGQIEKYQLTPRHAIIYIRGLTAGQKLELRYRLKAIMPVKVAVPPAEAYEYYNPAKRGASKPAQLEALET